MRNILSKYNEEVMNINQNTRVGILDLSQKNDYPFLQFKFLLHLIFIACVKVLIAIK